jgi:uncharacterized protein YyaL (SSP411 family)
MRSRAQCVSLFSTLVILFAIASPVSGAPTTQSTISWVNYSDDVFARAKTEHKFVLLDLQAIWCHWCHVMDHITYSDPKVIALINQKYIAVKVDQDSRPDISNRYEDFGWPATVVFNADGSEIVKRQGYIAPGPMARMLQAIIDDPTPGPSVQPEKAIQYGTESSLPAKLRAQLLQRFDANYDAKEGGWGTVHKYLDYDAIEWSMALAQNGDKQADQRARQSLDGPLHLIDPAWGGIYQYSTDDDWAHPHFEKIMQFQAAGIRTYALAYAQWHDPKYLKAAQDIRRYLANFLTNPQGTFYTSQDADLIEGEHSATYFALDDAGRRKLGIPRIDQHVYARENGWMIESLVTLYEVTADEQDLKDAVRAAQGIISDRSLAGGGFSHGQNNAGGPYLGDTLAMGRAFLSLYTATADRAWFDRAGQADNFIATHFSASGGVPGLLTSQATPGMMPPRQELDENVSAARFMNLLSKYSGKTKDHQLAENAMRYLATPQIALSRGPWGAGILLAASELSSEPLHVTVIGPKQDALAASLFKEALKCPVSCKRIEWWDRQEGPLPNADVAYPKLKSAAAFVCTSNTCSAPITGVEKLAGKLSRTAAEH